MNKEIDFKLLQSFKTNYESNFDGTEQNLVSEVGILDATVDYTKALGGYNKFENFIKTGTITNQRQSGRCWMFAGLNVIRTDFIKSQNLSDFDFSHNYLYFYDRMERANQFLEDIIDNIDKDIDDRLFSDILSSAMDDGAWWTTFSRLIDKYGIVPDYVYKDTPNAMSTNAICDVMSKRLRIAVKDLKKAYKNKKVAQFDEIKDKALADIYKIAAISLGLPPERFDLFLTDKDGKKIVRRNITPKDFYQEYIKADLSKYVEVANFPYKGWDENVLYERVFIKQRLGGNLRFLQVSSKRQIELVRNMIRDNNSVWYGCDVGQDSLIKKGDGYMYAGLLDRDALFKTDTSMTKEEALIIRESSPTHAMVILGYDDGEHTKYLVENSWSVDNGQKGYLVMDEEWFSKYAFEVVVKKEYLNPEELKALEKEPVEVMPWL